MFILHRFHIDLIVPSMGAEPFNIDNLRPIANRYHQSIIVPFNVEYYAIRPDDARIRVGPHDVRGTRPVRALDFMKPSVQGGFHCLLVSCSFQRLDKAAKGFSRDDSHRPNPWVIRALYTCSQAGYTLPAQRGALLGGGS